MSGPGDFGEHLSERMSSERLRERSKKAGRRARMWLAPGMRVKRWIALFVACTVLGAFGFLYFTWTGPWRANATGWILWLTHLSESLGVPVYAAGLAVIALALAGALYAVLMLNRSMLRGTGTAPERAVDLLYQSRSLSRGPRMVAVGGGTGLSNLLTGVKEHSRNITAIVTVADDGGSSGRLREALDMVAPGDLTDCYAALSDTPELARLLLHRFERGEGIEGHTFGNLMLATLSEEQGGLGNAMQDIHQILRVRGAVYPATTQPPTLVAELSDGRELRGESSFAAAVGDARIERVRLEPPNLPALPAVVEAIAEAEMVVLGPGSLFTSIIPALMVPDIAQAIRQSRVPVVYVASLMTEPGETSHMTLEDHVNAVSRHLGRMPDVVLLNNQRLDNAVLRKYQAEGAELLTLQGASHELRARVRLAHLLQPHTARHSPAALAQALVELLDEDRDMLGKPYTSYR